MIQLLKTEVQMLHLLARGFAPLTIIECMKCGHARIDPRHDRGASRSDCSALAGEISA